MKHTPITPLVATFGAPIAMIGLLFLAACSATPTPVAVSDLATPTSTREIITTSASEGDEGLESVSPTPEPLPAKPAPTQTIPVTAPVAVSPLPSPTLAADGASPTVAELVSGGPAPDFTLEGARGESVTLSDYQDGNPSNVLLVFYRGQT